MNSSSVTALREQSQPASTKLIDVDDAQHELPLSREPARVDVPMELIRAKRSKGAAFTLACDASGLDEKEIFMPLRMDKAQFSRIKSGTANLDCDQLAEFCRVVGNRIYADWLAWKVGCVLKEIESETQRQLRVAQEQIAKQEAELQLLRGLITGRGAA